MSLSYAWRGPRGCGKRTQLLAFLQSQTPRFTLQHATWFLNKQVNGGDPEEEDDDPTGKSIPYEESPLHLGFDVATMSMSDKVFLQSILSRWTGQQDVCLLEENKSATRYLVLYHAHYLTDESVLQLQECLEQYPSFAILLTTELPLSARLRDSCFEIPCAGPDRLLANYTAHAHTADGAPLSSVDIWKTFFRETLQSWSKAAGAPQIIVEVRNWIYTCLQRNLRWTDVMMYWMETIYTTPWLDAAARTTLTEILWRAESGAGWVLVTSYRIPILWEHVHLKLARQLHRMRVKREEESGVAVVDVVAPVAAPMAAPMAPIADSMTPISLPVADAVRFSVADFIGFPVAHSAVSVTHSAADSVGLLVANQVGLLVANQVGLDPLSIQDVQQGFARIMRIEA